MLELQLFSIRGAMIGFLSFTLVLTSQILFIKGLKEMVNYNPEEDNLEEIMGMTNNDNQNKNVEIESV